MLLEMLLCVIHSPPKVNVKFMCWQDETEIEYTSDMFCTLVTLMRVYYAWRYFAKYSTWTNNEKADKICKESNCEGGTSFAIKCELKERPYTIILAAITISILIFGFAMRAAEL